VASDPKAMLPAGIVGREQELAEVNRFLKAVPARRSALLIEGEPGIGKTTIWLAGRAAAADLGYRLLVHRASAVETQLAYIGLRDLVEAIIDHWLPFLPEPQQRALAFATLREEPAGGWPDQRTVAVGFLGILRLLAEVQPVVLAIDDAQWLDPPSARVLRFAFRRLESEPVALMAVLRLGGAARDPLGLEELATREGIRRMRVGPLSMGATDRLLRNRSAASLPRRLLMKVHEASGGNPFFSLELARALAARDVPLAPGEPLPLPDQLRDLPARAMRRLSRRTREVLLLVALSARPTVALLERAAGPDARASLDEALDAGVLKVEGQAIEFAHPLVAAAIEEMAPRERRRSAHGLLAEASDDLEQRAWHLALSIAAPDRAVARLLDLAAVRARSRGAPDAAADLLLQAANLTPADAMLDATARRIRAAVCRFESGDSGPARQALEEVIARTPEGQLRSEALRQLAWMGMHDRSLDRTIPLLQQALDEAGTDRRLRGSIEVALSWAVLFKSGDAGACLAHARAGIEALEGTSETGRLGTAMALAAFAEHVMGRPITIPLDRALELEGALEPIPAEWRPSFVYAYILKAMGELAAARQRFEALHRLVLDRGEEASLAFLLFQMSELESWAGNLDLAARYADDGYLVALQTSQEVDRAATLYARGLVDAYAGRLGAARSAANEALSLALQKANMPVVQLSTALLGLVALSADDFTEADHWLRPLVDVLASAGIGEPSILRFIPDEVEALVALGELERASTVLEPFGQRAEELQRAWAMSAAARCRGLIAAASGDLPAGLDWLAHAVSAHAAIEMPFEVGRTLLVKGRLERRAKHWRVARSSLEEAARMFAGVGASLWEAKAQRELRRVGGRPRGPTTLTETEQRVATLIASGRTTRQVADALFLTPRAVEANLGKVYQKLGIRSRAELGARMASGEGRPV
jgi:DNA-binding CsgD family transcriptional regulator